MSALITKVRTRGIPGHREQCRVKGRFFEGFHNESQALLLEARGQYQDAERAYTRASEYYRSAIPELAKFDDSPPAAQILQKADNLLLNAARMKAKQGRLANNTNGGRVRGTENYLRHWSNWVRLSLLLTASIPAQASPGYTYQPFQGPLTS